MRNLRFTHRVAAVGFGILAVWVVFVVVVRIVNVPLAGVQPEAFAMGAMLTAPLTLGGVLLVTLVSGGAGEPGAVGPAGSGLRDWLAVAVTVSLLSEQSERAGERSPALSAECSGGRDWVLRPDWP